MTTLMEAAEFLLSQGYILPNGRGKYKLSPRFNRDFKDHRSLKASTEVIVPDKFYFSSENRYKQFIVESLVPKRLENNRGEPYQANAFSIGGMKVYQECREAGIDMEILKRSVMLYYKSSIKYKMAIGRYMGSGAWRTGYDELLNAANTGEQAVVTHIKQELADDKQSHYKLG